MIEKNENQIIEMSCLIPLLFKSENFIVSDEVVYTKQTNKFPFSTILLPFFQSDL